MFFDVRILYTCLLTYKSLFYYGIYKIFEMWINSNCLFIIGNRKITLYIYVILKNLNVEYFKQSLLFGNVLMFIFAFICINFSKQELPYSKFKLVDWRILSFMNKIKNLNIIINLEMILFKNLFELNNIIV